QGALSMPVDQLRRSLESLQQSRPMLHNWGLRDLEGAWRNLTRLAELLGSEPLRELSHPLGRILPRCPDPDMAFNNLERFLSNPAGVAQLPTLLEPRTRCLETLLQLFSTSQFFSDLLSTNPDYLDMLQVPLRSSPRQAELQKELQAEVDAAFEDSAVLRIL